AIAEYKQAIALDPKVPLAHHNLGNALAAKGRLDDAIAEYKRAIDIDPKFASARFALGNALAAKGQLDDAIAHYKEAISLKEDYAEAYCNLGHVLREQGQFADALVQLRRGHKLGSKSPNWRHPSAQWIQHCERLSALDGKLLPILSGQMQPAD